MYTVVVNHVLYILYTSSLETGKMSRRRTTPSSAHAHPSSGVFESSAHPRM